MGKRNLNLETDYIEDSDEPMQFPEDTMTDEELNDEFDSLMSYFFGRDVPEDPELSPGKPETCLGGFEQNQDNNFENVQCENCDYYLACFPEEMLSSNG